MPEAASMACAIAGIGRIGAAILPISISTQATFAITLRTVQRECGTDFMIYDWHIALTLPSPSQQAHISLGNKTCCDSL